MVLIFDEIEGPPPAWRDTLIQLHYIKNNETMIKL